VAWVSVAKVAELPEGSMVQVSVEEDDIAVYHTPDGFFATLDVCTHASESLTKGSLNGNVVACPKHGGKFDVTTGAPVAFPCVYAVETYPVEVRGEEVWIEYPMD
jgi:3-phenylpropionate/trans-cinnamate dioxygenase ferredoxin subunit